MPGPRPDRARDLCSRTQPFPLLRSDRIGFGGSGVLAGAVEEAGGLLGAGGEVGVEGGAGGEGGPDSFQVIVPGAPISRVGGAGEKPQVDGGEEAAPAPAF